MESPHFQNGKKLDFQGIYLAGVRSRRRDQPAPGPVALSSKRSVIGSLAPGGAGGQSATADGGSRKPLPANGTRCKDQHGRAWQDRPGKPVRSNGRFTAGFQRFALPSRKPAPLPRAAGAAGPPVSPAEPTATRQTCHVSGPGRSKSEGNDKQ